MLQLNDCHELTCCFNEFYVFYLGKNLRKLYVDNLYIHIHKKTLINRLQLNKQHTISTKLWKLIHILSLNKYWTNVNTNEKDRYWVIITYTSLLQHYINKWTCNIITRFYMKYNTLINYILRQQNPSRVIYICNTNQKINIWTRQIVLVCLFYTVFFFHLHKMTWTDDDTTQQICSIQ